GHLRAADWLRATRDAIAACECATGCPSCVQSPKCGNGNEPLDKAGAVRLLDVVLASGLSGWTPAPYPRGPHGPSPAAFSCRLRARLNDETVVDAGDPYPSEADAATTTRGRGKHSV